jgi:hypothetical protein
VSFHVFAEDSIVPTVRRINIRNVLDTSGPHLITFGVRTVVADPVLGTFYAMRVEYETPNGQLRTISLAAPADLSIVSDALGAMWYADQVMVIDKYYPLSNGPQVSEPRGLFDIVFPGGGAVGSALISYECVVTVFDGSPAVTYHP